MLKRLVLKLRAAFPDPRIRIRLDSGFGGANLYGFFDAQNVEYVVGVATNSVLFRLAESAFKIVRADAEQDITTVSHGEDLYIAKAWSDEQRVIIKTQITTHSHRKLKEISALLGRQYQGFGQRLYEKIYCARGNSERRIKERKDGLDIGRTSCTSIMANQLRVLLNDAAYVLFQKLRLHAQGKRFASAQVSTLCLHLLMLGAWIEPSMQRIVCACC